MGTSKWYSTGTSVRLKVLWGPGLGALVVSLLSLHFLPKLFLPESLVSFPFGTVLGHIYYPGFLSLVVIGALAAYCSRRLGGNRAHRVLASLFPVFWEALRIPIRWVVLSLQPSASDVLFNVLNRILVPCIALLIGAALFLRDSRERSVSA